MALYSRNLFASPNLIGLGSGILAFDEDCIYIPTGVKNEFTYITIEGWWESTAPGNKDSRIIVYSIEPILPQILNCSDIFTYKLCTILDKGLETKTE